MGGCQGWMLQKASGRSNPVHPSQKGHAVDKGRQDHHPDKTQLQGNDRGEDRADDGKAAVDSPSPGDLLICRPCQQADAQGKNMPITRAAGAMRRREKTILTDGGRVMVDYRTGVKSRI